METVQVSGFSSFLGIVFASYIGGLSYKAWDFFNTHHEESAKSTSGFFDAMQDIKEYWPVWLKLVMPLLKFFQKAILLIEYLVVISFWLCGIAIAVTSLYLLIIIGFEPDYSVTVTAAKDFIIATFVIPISIFLISLIIQLFNTKFEPLRNIVNLIIKIKAAAESGQLKDKDKNILAKMFYKYQNANIFSNTDELKIELEKVCEECGIK